MPKRPYYLLTIAIALICSSVPKARAQTPRPVTPEPRDRPELQPLPPPEDLLELPPVPSPPTVPEFPGQGIPVKGFNVVGSTVFSAEELAAVLEPLVGRELSFAELLQAETAITQLYVENGYLNSGAVIPAPQTLEGGIVTVQVIEGGIEEIIVRGTGRLNPGYVRSRLAIATATPLNVNRLQEALQLLQLDPLIENLTAELSVGVRQELWVLEVDASRRDAFSLEAIADNSRTPSVGTFQRGPTLTHANLLGQGDSLSIGYRNTDGSDRYEASYTLPINPRNGTIGLNFTLGNNSVIETPFDELDIESVTRSYEVSFRQPILRNATPTFTQELALGIVGSHQQSETTLDGEPFPLSLGADAKGNTRVSALRFFQDWTRRDRRQVLAARSQFSLGANAFDATINDEEPDSRFFAWRGQFQYLRQIAVSDTTLLFRTDIQLAASDLVPLEQFGIGGIYSVRGYRQDALLTDSGVFTSVEMRLPVWRWRQVDGVLSAIPFIDFALGWNNGDRSTPDPNSLVALGLGLQWQMSDNFRARFDYGIPLVNIDSRNRTWQEQGLYFSVEYKGF